MPPAGQRLQEGWTMARMLDGMEALLRGEVAPPPAATLLGMRLASFAPGEARVELDASGAHGNPLGTVQGGILAAMADAAMGWAYMSTLGDGESYTTVEMKTNFQPPDRAGGMSAPALVKNAGRTLGHIQCDQLDSI